MKKARAVRVDRFHDPLVRLYEVADEPIHVVCPRCSSHAMITPRPNGPERDLRSPRTLSCGVCGYSARRPGGCSRWGGPVDPYFHQPLWLQAECRGQTLCALNQAHLDLLEGYVAAGLRERREFPGRRTSMLERLPRWVKSAKNRDAVLRTIHRLRTALEDQASSAAPG